MTFTYDPESNARDRNQVRMLIGDTDSTTPIFTDEQMDQFETDVYTWAAKCMMAIAASSALIATMCSMGNRDFVTDRKQVAKECREQARLFMEMAANEPYATEVHLEDETMTFIDGMGVSEYDFETQDTELNT